MYKWFINWFIKDKDSQLSAEKRAKIGSFAGGFGIVSNTFLSIIKMTVGLLSGSVSILAEGIDNLTDGASSLITIMGFRWSKAPADEEHPFGHQRIEYITGLLISFVILLVALLMGYRSVLRIINPAALEISYWTILLLGLTILVKLYQGGLYRYLAKLINSKPLKAASTDSFNDCLRTVAVIIGTFIYLITREKVNLDGYLGLFVSIYIFISGIKLLKDTSTPLIGTFPDDEMIKRLEKWFSSYEGILGFHDLVVHSYGPNRIYATVHIEVPSTEDVMKSHELIDRIEREVAQHEGVNLVIHMDPIDQNDELTNRLFQEVKDLIKEFDKVLSIHDFRVITVSDRKNIVFDVVCPPQYRLTIKELKSQIKTLIIEHDPTLNPIIQIDQFYVHSHTKED